ncbi:pyridoxamine 5'-phosphate oxidase family protein [Kitasatospora sp. NPDC094015]|uniref:pyridoxamine 5'-phosphate oxidase family protein n=1 Tax=Kitasatospora sp. NPDC094015 TaxID=3155205 RepID=UPI00332BE032
MQRRTGLLERADHVGRSIGEVIPPVAARFLTERRTLVLGAADRDGRLWATLLGGPAGFLRAADERTLAVATRPGPGDPLADALRRPAEVGTLALDPAGRRRMRVNGRATPDGRGGLLVAAEQVYSNCPRYIHRRSPLDAPAAPGTSAGAATTGTVLTLPQQLAAGTADTFFIATAGPTGAVDASHRGGPPGFLSVLGPDRLSWSEYPGNTMFMTLGNLELAPAAGLLLPDWESGGALLLTGTARVDWRDPAAPRVDYQVLGTVWLPHATALTWAEPAEA